VLEVFVRILLVNPVAARRRMFSDETELAPTIKYLLLLQLFKSLF
jgi:hypothetical protein